jgi:acyl-coenzyme A thioesterase PaaI-like protein
MSRGLALGHRPGHASACSRSLPSEAMSADPASSEQPASQQERASHAHGSSRAPRPDGPGALDGITGFMGMRWDDPQTVRLLIRPELINRGGLLSGVATYAMVDYCMGSTLWAQTTPEERIATINIAINYVQTATEGEIVCRSTLDRRNRWTAVMRSEVCHEDGRLLVTAIGSYTIFPARTSKGTGRPPATSPAS